MVTEFLRALVSVLPVSISDIAVETGKVYPMQFNPEVEAVERKPSGSKQAVKGLCLLASSACCIAKCSINPAQALLWQQQRGKGGSAIALACVP